MSKVGYGSSNCRRAKKRVSDGVSSRVLGLYLHFTNSAGDCATWRTNERSLVACPTCIPPARICGLLGAFKLLALHGEASPRVFTLLRGVYRRALLKRVERSIPGVAQSGHDKLLVVQFFVDRANKDLGLWEIGFHRFDALRRCDDGQ